MPIQAVNAIVFYVQDSELSKSFYQRLGFAVADAKQGHFRIALGTVQLEFHDARLESIAEFAAEARRTPKGTGLYFYFRVNELEEHRTGLLESGVVVSEIERRPWGNLECIVEDPDGYKIVFYRRAN